MMTATWLRPSTLLALVVILVMAVLFFGTSLFHPVTFGFRDAANYYYPLFQWQSEQWGDGVLPLWNSLESAGTPTMADATSSVFYPVKIIFAAPLPYWLRYNLYILVHVVGCAFTLFWVARRWGASGSGAVAGAIAYAFGGSVLFQYSNVVFLVGAAWLPLGLWAVDRLVRFPTVRVCCVLGSVLALVTLGGDPQTAYHLMIAAGLLLLVRMRSGEDRSPESRLGTRLGKPLLFLCLAAGIGFALAALQILPSADRSSASMRAIPPQPRTVLESLLDSKDNVSIGEAILQTPPAGSHHRQAYHYSVGPWHGFGAIWPNLLGRPFPTHQRWIEALPAEGKMWTPSLYLGFLPLLWGARGMKFRGGGPARPVWLTWTFCLFSVGAMGWYGVGWWANELMHAAGADTHLSPPVGGAYWWFVSLLPGYIQFRYPAKLLVPASCALCLLAARNWNVAVTSNARRESIWCWLFVGVSIAAIGIFNGTSAVWSEWTSTLEPDPLYGPFQESAARRDLAGGLLQTTVVAAAAAILLRWRVVIRMRSYLLLALVTCDLVIANQWMITTVSAELFHKPNAVANRLRSLHGDLEQIRLDREATAHPLSWLQGEDPHRVAEIVSWERSTLRPKYHLMDDIPLLESASTLSSLENRIASTYLRKHSTSQTRITSDGVEVVLRVSPRVWLAHEWETIAPLQEASFSAIVDRTDRILASVPPPWHSKAVIETNDSVPDPQSLSTGTCRIVSDRGNRILIEIRTTGPVICVLRDRYSSDWRATVTSGATSRSVPVWRTNRVMRGVYLPAGEHRVEYVFRPTSFYVGSVISALAWMGMIGAYLLTRRRPGHNGSTHFRRAQRRGGAATRLLVALTSVALLVGAWVAFQRLRDAPVRSAATALSQGQSKYALALLDEFMKAQPTHPEAARLRGIALSRLGLRSEEVVRTFRQFPPRNEQEWLAVGRAHRQRRHWSAALEPLRQAGQLPGSDPDIHLLLADCHRRLWNLEQAVGCIEEAMTRGADAERAEQLKADIEAVRDAPENRPLVEEPDSLESQLLLAHRFALRGNYRQAETLIDAALQQAPGDKRVIAQAERIYRRERPPALEGPR